MAPKDRLETFAKTKVGARQEKASTGDEPAPAADYAVAQPNVDALIENWPSAEEGRAGDGREVRAPNEATPSLLTWHVHESKRRSRTFATAGAGRSSACPPASARAVPLQAPYSAAKAGVVGLMDSLRVELERSRSRICVTTILPSSIDTPLEYHAGRRRAIGAVLATGVVAALRRS